LAGRTRVAPTRDQRAAAAIEHYETLLTLFGREAGLRHARKHIAAYFTAEAEAGNETAALLHQSAVRSGDPDTVVAHLRAVFSAPVRLAA